MKRTYVSLDEFPELKFVPWNVEGWPADRECSHPLRRAPEQGYSAMLRYIWLYYNIPFHDVATPMFLEIQKHTIQQIKDYKEEALDCHISRENWGSQALFPPRDFRYFLAYNIGDTIRSKGNIFYGFEMDKYDWWEATAIVLPIMCHFLQKNVGLLEQTHENNKKGKHTKFTAGEFRLD